MACWKAVLRTCTATISPGNSAGTLNFGGDLGLNSSSVLDFELNAFDMTVGGGVNDLLTITGDLTLDGLLSISSGDAFTGLTSGSWTLATYGGSLVDNGLDIGSMPTLDPTYSWSVNTSTPGVVNLTIIPEPKAFLLAMLGSLALLRRRRA